jgi:hypothetical protein
MGGLSVQADISVDQGDVLNLVLHPDRLHDVPIQAIVWHQRRVRQRVSGREFTLMGLVLSEAPEDFHDRMGLSSEPPSSGYEPRRPRKSARLVESAKTDSPREATAGRGPKRAARPTRARAARTHGAGPSAASGKTNGAATRKPVEEKAPAAPGLPRPERYRVRVTMTGKPRTRSILVFAGDGDEARYAALGETGKGWEVLEVEKA